jgi:CBS domain-containing protein
MASKEIVEMTAGDVMHRGCTCIAEQQSLIEASRMMYDLGVGALPICGTDERLLGMLTDRDIVVKCLARGKDPARMRAGEMAQGPLIWVHDHQGVHDVVSVMEEHRVRRVPVLDKDKQLVGMIAQADIARRLGHELTGELLEAVSRGPAMQQAV